MYLRPLDGMTPKSKENQFYAQVFQAVRIEVNQELDSLKLFLEQCEKNSKTQWPLSGYVLSFIRR